MTPVNASLVDDKKVYFEFYEKRSFVFFSTIDPLKIITS